MNNKKVPLVHFAILNFLIAFLCACEGDRPEEAASSGENVNTAVNTETVKVAVKTYPAVPDTLPPNLTWETNLQDPPFASDAAVKGGRLRLFIESFPLTFRRYGPDSNALFSANLNNNQLGLTAIHPNTGRFIPELATHWAFGADRKTDGPMASA